MFTSPIFGTIHVTAESCRPKVTTAHGDGCYTMRLLEEAPGMSVVLTGTPDALRALGRAITDAMSIYENTEYNRKLLGVAAPDCPGEWRRERVARFDAQAYEARAQLADADFVAYLHKFGYDEKTMTPGAVNRRYEAYRSTLGEV